MKFNRPKAYFYDEEGRSREGAWIEIITASILYIWSCRRSREGAWIEIICVTESAALAIVAPARERGLKYRYWHHSQQRPGVAPARERGLKFRELSKV